MCLSCKDESVDIAKTRIKHFTQYPKCVISSGLCVEEEFFVDDSSPGNQRFVVIVENEM